MIDNIRPEHYDQILRINTHFVHWLTPLDTDELDYILSIASYQRQIDGAKGVLIGYPHDANYPDHKNLTWLNDHAEDFFYIDRVIIDPAVLRKGYGRLLYEDVENYARQSGYKALACEVYTKPDNSGSHEFHLASGFESLGEEYYPAFDKAVRYYKKPLSL